MWYNKPIIVWKQKTYKTKEKKHEKGSKVDIATYSYNVISVQTFASLSQRDTGVTYTILKFIDDEDTVIYQLVERAEPIEKK